MRSLERARDHPQSPKARLKIIKFPHDIYFVRNHSRAVMGNENMTILSPFPLGLSPASTLGCPKITCALTCYNEEARIGHVLAHAVQWADEVLVINKGSTDKTVEICASHGDRVKVVDFPYAEQGDDDPQAYFAGATYDWLFVITCSEVPTRKIIEAARKILQHSADEIDIVFVPRKIYSFGEYHPTSPWSIAYYPFLIQRKRALLSKKIHANFTAADPTRVATIAYADDCCVHHFTHASAASYMETVGKYVKIEVGQLKDGQLESAIVSSLAQIRQHIPGILGCGRQWPTILAAWCIYHCGVILHAMERLNGGPVQSRYHALRQSLISTEWGITNFDLPDTAQGPEPVCPSTRHLAWTDVGVLKAACLAGIVCLCVLRPSLIGSVLRSRLRMLMRRWRPEKS